MAEFKFKIRNVKLFGDVPHEITLNLNPHKINFVIAPNGTGKTSFTTAFKCLENGRIDVPLEWKYKKLKNAPSFLSITNENKEWIANGRSNKITTEWNPFVIDSGVHTNIDAIAGPRGAMVNEPVTRVMSICVKDNIPVNSPLPYNFQAIKAGFGVKRGALKDYTLQINSVKFLLALKDALPCLYQFNYYQTPKDRVDQLVSIINNKDGNVRTLKTKMTDADFKTIEQYKLYKKYKASFTRILGSNAHKLDYFLLFYQLMKIYDLSPDRVKSAVSWAEYTSLKDQLKLDLECVSCPWKSASLRESEDNKLYIDYPLVNEYSNGQRDMMTLYSKLLIFKQALADNKKYLLILDEVFDYLDDANLLAAQYFVSTLLEHHRTNTDVYVILFTHLNPHYFRTYVLKNKINVQYMFPQEPIATKTMKNFIGYRSWLKSEGNNGDDAKKELYRTLSNFLFHYNPSNCNCREEIAANQYQKQQVRETWGEKEVLYEYLIQEVNKYLKNENYDPYAVAFAMRVRVEKLAYDLIQDNNIKSEFLNKHSTYEKIEVCTSNGIQVPLFYMITLPIGNEADHLHLKGEEYQEKEMVYKLRNNTIKTIISKMFDYEKDAPVLLSSILNN